MDPLTALALGVGGSIAGDALVQSFDKTAQEICACLDVIDKTLVDGFARRDVETEKLKRSIVAAGSDRMDAAGSLATTRKFRDIGMNGLPPIFDVFVAQLESIFEAAIEDVDRNLPDLEAQLVARQAEVAAGVIPPALDDAVAANPLSTNPLSTNPLDPTASGQGLTDFCEAFTAKLDELLAAIEELAARSAAAMEGISAGVGAVEGEALAAGAEMSGEAAGTLDEAFSRMEQSAESTFARIAQSGLGASDQLRSAFASLDNVIGDSLGKLGPLISQLLGGGPASFLGSLFGLAGGGTAQPGLPILVGERGPEIFLPSGPGRVLNAHNTARAMGGAGAGGQQIVVNQTNSFTTDVRNTVRAEVLNAMPLATNIAARQVSDMLRGIRR